MRSHRVLNTVVILGIVLFIYFIFAPASRAGVLYDAEAKLLYEDNVVGLLSDKRGGAAGMTGAMGAGMIGAMTMTGGPGQKYTGSSSQSSGDASLDIFADLGISTDVASDTSLFLLGSVEHTSYSRFTEFDSTIGNVSAGVIKSLGDIFLARVAANGRIKGYNNSARNSSAYGGTFTLKEKLDPAFWLKEIYEYEKNDASSAIFTYRGNSVSIWAGYLATPKSTVLLGYNYLVRDYDQPSGFRVTANTVSLGLQHEIGKKWFVDGQYDRQMSNSNVAGTYTTDNIVSVGLRYSY